MHRIFKWFGPLVCLFCMVGAARAASICDSTSGNIVTNCGFESGSFSGWSVTGNLYGGIGGNYVGVDNSNPNSGNYEAYLGAPSEYGQTGTPGDDTYGPVTTLSQTLAGTPGEIYEVTFYLDNTGCSVSDPDCPGYYNYFDASFNGQVLMQQDNLNETDTYNEYVFVVTASYHPELNDYLLQFDSTNDDGYFYLDDVSVQGLGLATPEPSSLALLGTGLLGTVGVLRRKFSR